MTIDEKVKKTPAGLGVIDAAGVEALFTEVRVAMAAERASLVSHGAASEPERDKLCKDLRDRWLARKNGLLSFVDENWLKASPKELKPAVGRYFNGLRQESAAFAIATLTKDVPLHVSATFGIPAESLRQVSSTFEIQEESLTDLTLPGNRRPDAARD
jgi:hypothetical protein